jgi:hypothetical protein
LEKCESWGYRCELCAQEALNLGDDGILDEVEKDVERMIKMLDRVLV